MNKDELLQGIDSYGIQSLWRSVHVIVMYNIDLLMYVVQNVIRGCLWQPLYCFHFYFWYATLDIYIFIICHPMHNRNNEFILIYIARRKMADFECRDLEIGLEFGRSSFAKRNNFKVSSEPKEYTQVIQVRRSAAPILFSFQLPVCNACPIYIYIYI